MISGGGPGKSMSPDLCQNWLAADGRRAGCALAIHITEETLMIARQLSIASLALAACFASGTIGAQQPPPANAKEAMTKFSEKFKAADANHDGKLTREEAQAGMPEV